MFAVMCYTAIAMLAFAANSLLCRMALSETGIDPATFTFVRLLSGALVLFVLLLIKRRNILDGGSWSGALALFLYAAGFSFAYVNMSTGTGALLLFGAVQISMLVWGFIKGDVFSRNQIMGFVLAVCGLIFLLLPGIESPPLFAALLMIMAGTAWGAYSLLGRGVTAPLLMTGGNFVKATPMAAILFLYLPIDSDINASGVVLAVLSGALASGVGYAIWYHVLPSLKATQAATIQLSVPVIAMVMGWVFLDEVISVQMLVASVAILGGIVLVIRSGS